MKRLLCIVLLLAAGCGESAKPAPPPAAAPAPAPAPVARPDPEALLSQAEKERAGTLYESAATAFTAVLEGDPKNGAAAEGRALARWRLSLMRGNTDPEVAKDLETAGNRPRATALKALVRMVDRARNEGGWESLAPRILKSAFTAAFPDSDAFKTDWVALVRAPDGEIQRACESLAGAPDWPLAVGVKAALEGRDIPAPGSEGILWILTALRLPASEAMKTLESATGPDQGILLQAQAQLLAAEGKFTEATGRAAAAPLPILKAAVAVSNGKPAMVLETVGEGTSPFARALKAAALLQTGTPEAMDKLSQVEEVASIPWLRFERGIRRLASGNREAALEDLKATSNAGGATSAAWLGFALWHAQDFDGAIRQLEAAEKLKPSGELAVQVDEIRGYALQAKGEEEAGAERLVAAATRTPTREIYFKIATHLRGNRQWKALQELAQPVARSFPADPEPWAAKAEASFWLKDYDAAISTVTFAMGQKIDHRRYLKWRALAYEEKKKWAEAFEDWDKLKDVVTVEGDAHAHRAWMGANLGRWSGVKEDAEQGISRGGDAWSSALARFALAAEALHGTAGEGETVDAASRKETALEHLRIAVKTGAVEPSDLKAEGPFAPLAGTEEWKKIVESSAEKQKELKDQQKRGSFLGVMLDHGGGSVAVTGTYRKTGARQAGLAPGDVILEVEGQRVSHIGDVGSLLAGRDPGVKVKLKIERELRPKLKLVEVREVTLTSRDIFDD